jgi:hypothetical protein
LGRAIPPELFDETDELGDFLFDDEVELCVEVAPALAQDALTVLGNEHHGGEKKGCQADEALQPEEWWWVEGEVTAELSSQREDDPRSNQSQLGPQEEWPAEEGGESGDGTMLSRQSFLVSLT